MNNYKLNNSVFITCTIEESSSEHSKALKNNDEKKRMVMIFQDTEKFLHLKGLVWLSVDLATTSTSVSLLENLEYLHK